MYITLFPEMQGAGPKCLVEIESLPKPDRVIYLRGHGLRGAYVLKAQGTDETIFVYRRITEDFPVSARALPFTTL